jgi:hypothetical protein
MAVDIYSLLFSACGLGIHQLNGHETAKEHGNARSKEQQWRIGESQPGRV